MQQLELKSNNPFAESHRNMQMETLMETLKKNSDDKELMTIEETFEDLESVTLNFKEALKFMEIPKEKFIELLENEKTFSKNFSKHVFPALFLIDLKLKFQDSQQVD